MKLIKIAMNMRSDARRAGRARQRLPRGLRLTLQWIGAERRWKLSLTRDNVTPSAEEEQICRQAFRVPDDADREYTVEPFGGIDWHVVRLSWVMLEQLPLGIQAPVKAVRYE